MSTIKHVKKYLFLIALIGFLVVFTGCQDDIVPPAEDADVTISLVAIPGVTAPVIGETPVTTITPTDQYTGTVLWSPADSTYLASTVYTATITLTPKTGFTLTGVAEDSFTVDGATPVTNPADSGVVTAVFPATTAAPDEAITIAAIPGLTAPVRGEAPDLTVTDTAQYTGTVTWAPVANPYEAETVYTATITLTPKAGFTLTGVAANFFTVAGATPVTNPINSGVVTATFPATAAAPDEVMSIAAIPGVTAPVVGEVPVSTITPTDEYTGTVSWSPIDNPYVGTTVYIATITLTPKAGFTLTGVAANFFTVLGATPVTNPADSGVVTATFPITGASTITTAAIPGVTAPVIGETPVTTITPTDQYTGTVTWSPADSTYAASTVYTATITLVAKTGFTLSGVAENLFTVAGATSDTNSANSGIVTAVFPATEVAPDVAITIAAIPGVTAPVVGEVPVTVVTDTTQYTGTVSWSPSDNPYVGNTVYTATITLVPKTGYTLTGVAADFFTVVGTTSVTNPANSGIVTAVFPITGPSTITTAAIPGVTAPVRGETPVTTISVTDQYTGSVTWSPADSTYAASTVYTATITLVAKTGFTLSGVAENLFTVAGATSDTNPANSGIVTAVFPATEVAPDEPITIAAIPGVTAPVRGEIPVTVVTDTTQYTGTVAWSPVHSPYAASTVYTATITLTPKAGFTLTGVAADFFTVLGATPVTNPADSGVVTAAFPETEPAPITIAAVPGVTVPVRGEAPDLTVTDTEQYTGTVTWAPVHDPYAAETVYTATITLTAKAGFTLNGVAANFFTVAGSSSVTNTINAGDVVAIFPATGVAPVTTVELGTAGNYVILAKTMITTTGTTAITGDLGLSPAATAGITGFGLANDSTNVFATSALVTGNIYASDMADPTPANLTTAVANMTTAYNDAAGRTTSLGKLDLLGGAIGGETLAPGVYTWGTSVGIGADLTLNGGADDIWIFQITGTLDLAGGFDVLLTGGATYDNVFWQVTDIVTVGTGAHMEGIILGMTQIIMQTNSSINGRLLAQTQVPLDAATIVAPAII